MDRPYEGKGSPPHPGGGRWGFIVLILSALTLLGVVGFLLRLRDGFGDRGAWGYYAATFSFLIATTQTAPVVAFGLRLSRAHWRGPIVRAAELFAVVGVLNWLWFLPLQRLMPPSLGERSIWFGFPGAPQRWDMAALTLMVLSGLALLYLGALPDLATPPQRSPSQRPLLGRFPILWLGTSRQWRVLLGGLMAVGAFYSLGVVLVNLLVGADLAMSLVPGWKDSVFPPYQVVAAFQSGVAAVILALFFLRRAAGVKEEVGREQFWGLGRLLLVLTLLWFYFTWSGFLVFWYGRRPEEQVMLQFLFTGPSRQLYLFTFLFSFAFPFLLLLWNPVRRSIPGPTLAAGFILVGSLLDKIRLYGAAFQVEEGGHLLERLPIPPLEAADFLILIGGIAAAALCYWLAAKFFPVLSGWEVAQGKQGQARLPFLRREARVVAGWSHESKTDTEINRELLAPVLGTPRWFWPLIAGLGGVLLVAAVAAGILFTRGLGVAGINRPVYWGFFITNFVFWVGISHAGVMMSSILRLARAEWRRPITRAAELLTVFALMAAALFPIIHSGRPWRTIYWLFPYDFPRNIWPNLRSPLFWDLTAIFTYLTAAILFVYVTLLPDLATLRDRSGGWRRDFYGLLSLGWRGTGRQWRLQALGGILLSALILPIFVSVHSIVSWDFAVATAIEGWHSTIFAPYFVIGAILSGVAAVVTVMVLMRSLWGWKSYIRPEHLDVMGKLLIVVAMVWFHFFALEFIFGLYGLQSPEIALRELLLFHPPWNILFGVFLLSAFFIPVSLWFFRSVRRSPRLMLLTSLLVNLGMWLERFLIIVPGAARKQAFTFVWGSYRPTLIEISIVAGSFALVFLGLVLFAKLFPLVPVADQKEAQVVKKGVRVGRVEEGGVVWE